MSKIFLSYRRADTRLFIQTLVDRLEQAFGKSSVYVDIDSIPVAVDFRKHLVEAVEQCDVLIAVIGKNWMGEKGDGGLRLHSTDDFVRIEIETALRLGIPVVPALVDDVRMPSESQLPKDLAPLAYRNATQLNPGTPEFNGQARRLIAAVRHLLGQEYRDRPHDPDACPQCNARVSPDARFCRACGHAQFEVCPRCEAEESVRAKFCGSCGSDKRGFRQATDVLADLDDLLRSNRCDLAISRLEALTTRERRDELASGLQRARDAKRQHGAWVSDIEAHLADRGFGAARGKLAQLSEMFPLDPLGDELHARIDREQREWQAARTQQLRKEEEEAAEVERRRLEKERRHAEQRARKEADERAAEAAREQARRERDLAEAADRTKRAEHALRKHRDFQACRKILANLGDLADVQKLLKEADRVEWEYRFALGSFESLRRSGDTDAAREFAKRMCATYPWSTEALQMLRDLEP